MPCVIGDEPWSRLGPLVGRAKRPRAGAPPGLPDRQFLEAVLYLADSGCKWRQLPERYGAWDAVYNRFQRRAAAGVFARIFADLPPDAASRLGGLRRAFFDSAVSRAHARAAGAPAKRGGKRPRPSAAAGAGSRPRSTWPRPTSGRRSGSS